MWLLTLIEKITCFIPRIKVIRPDSAGFRTTPKPWFGGGTWTVKMEPKHWYWIWPMFMEFEIIPTKTQVKDIRVQSLWTKDGKDVAIGGAIRYYVKDNIKAQLEVYGYDDTIQNIALLKISTYVRKHTLEELKSTIDDLCKELLKEIREASEGWGLKIQEVGITDVGHTRNFRLLHSGILE